MKYIAVLLFCTLIFDKTYSCSRPALKSKEYELKILKDTHSISSSDIYIKKLEDDIKLLKTECHDFRGVSIQCWDASYICNSKGYIAGCPCWKYKMEYDNVTTARLTFNKFYPNGVKASTNYYEESLIRPDTILEVCDYVSPPWPFYQIYDDNAGLAEFTHCIQDWRIDCFCSSAQHSDRKESNESVGVHNRDEHELCDHNRHNCSDVIDGNSGCSCWNYNISYVNNDVTNLTLLADSKIDNYLTPKVNIVICKKPYSHCSDENLAEGCPCWEYEIMEQDAHKIQYAYHEIVRFEASKKTEEEKRFELAIQKECGHRDPIKTSNHFGDGFLTTFTHCNNNGQIICYCRLTAADSVLQSAGCAYRQINVNGRCVDSIDD